MFMKTGNYKEFGVEVGFEELELFLLEIIEDEEQLCMDINGVVSVSLFLNDFDFDIISPNKSNKRFLILSDDTSEQICPIYLDMKDIKKIIAGTGFYADQYILILKHNIMYHLYIM
ncbi:hypothetical protein SAMN02745134_00827 [Clostridium acidisoli DSM 12555]|uniref:Uncharacterized protein n=1 Tax=Clostridium acidisoli DSM 12555 TaxID=1121291 RepID=A0A1W1X6H9_9CLOT|nr:hypothetical protein [Clostridium acidisoli]SMC19427.1 hypothetical protein SAMN02745134_00827 [Clostridium acidisoli DSM 12555]